MSSHAPKVDPVAKLFFLASAVAILLVVYILLSSLVSTYKRNSTKGEVDSSYRVAAASDNLKPIGISSTSDAPVAGAAGRDAKEVYTAVCSACHGTGILESPKFGDKAAWSKRAEVGLDALVTSATNGKGSMPAKGGDPSLSDAELKAVILYMTKESGVDLGGAAKPAAAPAPEKKQAEAPKEEAPKAMVTETETKVEEKVVEKVAEKPVAPAPAEAPKADPEPAAPAVAAAPEAPKTGSANGKKVYDSVCFACHATGVAGSPKLGDKAIWAPRIATGMEAMYQTALNGKGAMPPKGGNTSISDADVKAAVDYMVSQAQ